MVFFMISLGEYNSRLFQDWGSGPHPMPKGEAGQEFQSFVFFPFFIANMHTAKIVTESLQLISFAKDVCS